VLGPADGERIAVLDGLLPGDRVVVDGTDRLRDGLRVAIAGEATRPGVKQQRSKTPQASAAP
jgi:membrane fusion protein, multidrug efflux system